MDKTVKTPRVTVLMSAYNSESYIRQAIESILAQTYTNFEFLIINDGSTDSTLKHIKAFKDTRIRLISRKNKGLVASLNEGIELARGEFIARQDSDDTSVPERLAKEVAFLDSHPSVAMVGSNYTIMDSKKWEPIVTTNVFTHPKDLKLTQITCNQYGHGSVMMRTEAVRKLNGYDSSVGYVEDYDLWTRLSQAYDIANIVEPLYLYRRNEGGITQQNLELQVKQTFAVRDNAFKYYLTHRRRYSPLFYKPSGTEYRRRKATLYRDLAYLYRVNGRPFGALRMMALALFLQPRNEKNYRYIRYVLDRSRFDRWEYEFL
jgi:glycosyltransferase involved in cell wall biosynthesis